VGLTIQGRNGSLSFLVGTHLDETEAFASIGVAVHDDLSTLHRPVGGEELLQIRAADFVTKVSYIQLFAHHQSPVRGHAIQFLLSGSVMKEACVSA
jgi:hypothetical protein